MPTQTGWKVTARSAIHQDGVGVAGPHHPTNEVPGSINTYSSLIGLLRRGRYGPGVNKMGTVK